MYNAHKIGAAKAKRPANCTYAKRESRFRTSKSGLKHSDRVSYRLSGLLASLYIILTSYIFKVREARRPAIR